MKTLVVKSWNVLHGVHEFNYQFQTSPVLKKYQCQYDPSKGYLASNYAHLENQRIRDLAKTIKNELQFNVVACLQEVPGNLLDLLKIENPDYICYSYKYPRLPILKNLSGQLYSNSAEFLVTMAHKSLPINQVQTIQFDDPGKACLFLEMKDLSILNTHLSFGIERNKALDQIFAAAIAKNFVLVGDMNIDPNEFKQYLIKSKLYHLQIHQTFENTRKGVRKDGLIQTSNLDYYIAPTHINFRNVQASNNLDLSDHCLITAMITWTQ